MPSKIKICGLQSAKTAREAVVLGVEYIGLVFYSASKRFITLGLAHEIAKAVQAENGIVVPVFVNQNSTEIKYIAEHLNTRFVQLHGLAAIAAYQELGDEYQCILPAHLIDDFELYSPAKDFLLYDNPIPGSGQVFDWGAAKMNKSFRCFISGGLSSDNICDAMAHFQPYGFDMSSGVEGSDGKKLIEKIDDVTRKIKSK